MITFDVPGKPVPQGSKRHVGRGILVEQTNVLPWRAAIAACAPRPAQLIEGPVRATLVFTFERPKKHYRTGRHALVLREDAPAHYSRTPDADKLARAVLDALTGVVWRDDGQVSHLVVVKQYGTAPGLRAFIDEVSPP